MESIGEKLRSAREAKKLSIREVAKDTNIAPRYIEALEAEEFDRFPGETYITGFLRSYSEYLKIDADDMIQSYKGYKIGESATPLEELTRPTSPDLMIKLSSIVQNYRKWVYAGAGVLGLLLISMIYGIISSSSVNLSTDDSISKIKNEYNAGGEGDFENIRNLKLQNDKGFILVYKNEAVQFLVDTKEVMFVVRDIKDKEIIVQMLPEKQFETLSLDSPKSLSVPGAAKPVVLTLKGLTEGRANIKVALGEAAAEDDAAAPSAQPAPAQGDTTTVVAQNEKNLKIVFEAEFTAKTYVELYLDGNEKTKGVVQPGTRERWEATDLIQIKIGNAGGVKARVNGKDYTFGLPGQVANKVITWKKDASNPNQYQIVVRDWY
ncbi:MAG: helix-turn-helix domain-containing protein [Spirochaetota bacterium]